MRDWTAIKNGMSRDEFCRRHPHPFFLSVGGNVAEDVEFATGVVSLREGEPNGVEPTVFPITKTGTNPFRDRILVGRARNCDIVLSDASVSKLHADVRPHGVDAAQLTDRESRNGTQVNERPVPPRSTVTLRSGDRVGFGGSTLLFLGPGELYDLL